MNQTNEINQTNRVTVPSLSLTSAEQAAASLPALGRVIRGLLYVYIFSLPFPQLLFVERNGFILLMVLLVIWCAVGRRHFFIRTPLDVPLLALVGWVAISLPFAASPAYSAGEFGKLLQQWLMFYVAVHFFQYEHDRARLSWVILGGLMVISAYGIWQFAAKIFGGAHYQLIHSLLSSESSLTTYLVTVVPIGAVVAWTAQRRWQRGGVWAVTGSGILCQLLTFSRAGLLALFAEAIMFAMLVRRRAVTAMVAAFIACAVAVAGTLVLVQGQESRAFVPSQAKLSAYNLESRVKVWEFGLSKLLEHPLVGMGYGKNNFYNVTKNDPRYLEAEGQVPMAAGLHNTFLDISVGAGLPAGLAYLWLMWAGLRAGIRQFRSDTDELNRMWSLALAVLIAGVFARNLFDHMWIGSMALLFWVLVAVSLKPVGGPEKAAAS